MFDFSKLRNAPKKAPPVVPRLVVGVTGHRPHKLHSPGMQDGYDRHNPTMSDVVCMLLRVNFLGSQKRAAWMRANTPSVYVLPKRPSFKSDGKTDATEYAWFLWDGKPSRVVII